MLVGMYVTIAHDQVTSAVYLNCDGLQNDVCQTVRSTVLYADRSAGFDHGNFHLPLHAQRIGNASSETDRWTRRTAKCKQGENRVPKSVQIDEIA